MATSYNIVDLQTVFSNVDIATTGQYLAVMVAIADSTAEEMRDFRQYSQSCRHRVCALVKDMFSHPPAAMAPENMKSQHASLRGFVRTMKAATTWTHFHSLYCKLDTLLHPDAPSQRTSKEAAIAQDMLPPHLFQQWRVENAPEKKPAVLLSADELDICFEIKTLLDNAVRTAIDEENEKPHWKQESLSVVNIMASNEVRLLTFRTFRRFLSTPLMLDIFLKQVLPSMLSAAGATGSQLLALEGAVSSVRGHQESLQYQRNAQSEPDHANENPESAPGPAVPENSAEREHLD